jgi:uncharacterized protein YbcI
MSSNREKQKVILEKKKKSKIKNLLKNKKQLILSIIGHEVFKKVLDKPPIFP